MKIRPFYVAPVLPEALKPLQEIATNVWFSWNWEAVRLFIRIDAELWEKGYQNPVAMLGRVSQERLKHLAQDDSYVTQVERVHASMQEYLTTKKWFARKYPNVDDMKVAYFSCEYGLDEGLPIYSGGLGILSGDHLKSASDLGIPLVAVGLLYRQGYFRQRLNADGWQMEEYPENDWYNMPVKRVTNESGEPALITVMMGSMPVFAQIWQVQVGSTSLYLLDTNFETNEPRAREITTQLYGGDRDMRLRQELLLGIGGIRALKIVGVNPTVFHINEGHSAFLLLERMRDLIETKKLTFEEAKEIVWSSTVFTTHTPVPAGNEQFDAGLLKRYGESKVARLGITWNDFLKLGRIEPKNQNELFGMTVFALRHCAFNNGVSALHGTVSRKMWNSIWPNVPVNEVPITHITNGIHTRSWLSHDMGELFDSYLGPRFVTRPWEFDVWERVDRIPDVELWRTHQRRRERLVFFVRQRLKRQLERRGAHRSEIIRAEEVLDPHAITIGFARRFATYKRAHLLFRDRERLRKIISDSERPVQFIFAGKAHPQDHPGKEIIKSIIHMIREEPFRSHIAFIEDYDINVARYLVQGVDVWLNTPILPLEASGTSGMKVATNGGLNLSILDGWWAEGYHPDVGWAIDSGENYESSERQDTVESESLYNCLEKDVVPLFYHREGAGLPREWIEKMKASMKQLGRQFNTHRMLEEYTEQLYLHAHHFGVSMRENEYQRGKNIAAFRKKINQAWEDVEVVKVNMRSDLMSVGSELPIAVEVQLGSLAPEDVVVEAHCGVLDSQGNFQDGTIYQTSYAGKNDNGTHNFTLEIPFKESGRHGLAIRVRPYHSDLGSKIMTEFISWG